MKHCVSFCVVALVLMLVNPLAAQSTKLEEKMLTKPALVVVDMQNDFVREGAPMEVPDARKTTPQIRKLLQFFRENRLPVIFTRFIGTPDSTLLWNWSPKIAAPLYACRPGYYRIYQDRKDSLEAIAIIDELAPLKGELIIDKFGYGAFHKTNLDSLLKQAGIETIVLTGTVTQICVEETGREAFHHGYKTVMIQDGVSSFMPDLHNATIKNFAMKFGWVTTAENALFLLRGFASQKK